MTSMQQTYPSFYIIMHSTNAKLLTFQLLEVSRYLSTPCLCAIHGIIKEPAVDVRVSPGKVALARVESTRT